jgi:hypothetical protein
MTRLELIARLERMDACGDSLDWLHGLTCETAEEAYSACERADWMLWLAGRAGLRHQAVSLACDYAGRVLPIAETWLRANRPKHSDAPRRAIEAARSGAVTPAIRRAADAAYYAAYYAAYAAAAAAAAVRSTERAWQAARFREVISWPTLLAAMEAIS